MTKQNLVNQIVEELTVGFDLGYSYEHSAKNIIAIVEGSKEHLDYDQSTHQFNWEEEE